VSDEATLLLTANGIIHTPAPLRAVVAGGSRRVARRLVLQPLRLRRRLADPEWLETQWLALLDTGTTPTGCDARRSAQARRPLDVTIHNEKIAGSEPALYFAHAHKSIAGGRAFAESATLAGTPGPAARFAPLIERSQLGFFDLDFANRQFYFSPAWKNLLGFLDKDLADQETTWRDLVHPEDSAAAPDHSDRRPTNQTRAFSTELRMRTKGGSYEWVLCNGIQFFGDDGTLLRVLGTMTTSRSARSSRSPASPARSASRRSAARPISPPSISISPTAFTGFSAGLRKLTGYRDSELPASPESFAHLLPAELVQRGAQVWFAEQSPGQSIVRDSIELTTKDGQPLLVHAVFVRTFDRRKALQRVIGYLVPGATPGAPARMPPLLLRASFDAINEGIVVADREARVIFLNARAARMLGTTPEHGEGRSAADLVPLIHRLNQQRIESPITRAIEHGDTIPLNDEHSLPAGDGLRRIVFTCVPAKDTDDKIQGAVFVFRDPEEMTLTPDELIRSNRFETLGLLAGGIAHDFNNLLTTILGGISIAREARDYSQLEDSEKAASPPRPSPDSSSPSLVAVPICARSSTPVRSSRRPSASPPSALP
jgi:PAS domain S-box-containing protein